MNEIKIIFHIAKKFLDIFSIFINYQNIFDCILQIKQTNKRNSNTYF